MNKVNIIRAWKDQAYRNSLTPEERAALPENPAGTAHMSNKDMDSIHGGELVVSAKPGTLFRSRRFTCSKYHCVSDFI